MGPQFGPVSVSVIMLGISDPDAFSPDPLSVCANDSARPDAKFVAASIPRAKTTSNFDRLAHRPRAPMKRQIPALFWRRR